MARGFILRTELLRRPRCIPHNVGAHGRKASTATGVPPIQAAQPFDEGQSILDTSHVRVVPDSASYFTARPQSTDNLLNLHRLLLKHALLPVVTPTQAPRVAWRTLPQYRLMVGEPLQASKYGKAVELLQRLNRIHPSVKPREIEEALGKYKRDLDPFALHKRPAVIDQDGKTCQVGRRKASKAKVFLVQGDGKVLINGKTLNSAFGRVHDRDSAIWALKSTGRLDKYNVWALVTGGGTTGQAEAVTLGVAKALMVFEPALKPALRRGEVLILQPSLMV